jgi:hypothetical protein
MAIGFMGAFSVTTTWLVAELLRPNKSSGNSPTGRLLTSWCAAHCASSWRAEGPGAQSGIHDLSQAPETQFNHVVKRYGQRYWCDSRNWNLIIHLCLCATTIMPNWIFFQGRNNMLWSWNFEFLFQLIEAMNITIQRLFALLNSSAITEENVEYFLALTSEGAEPKFARLCD